MPEHKAIFVSVPKCGTRTMYTKVLPQHYGGQRFGGHHETRVPDHARDWFTFTIVRDPYQRAVSLWWSTTQRAKEKTRDRYGFRKNVPEPDSLESFMRYLVEHKPCVMSLGPNQVQHLQGVRLDRVLRLENLDEDFKRLPFYSGRPNPLPVVNETVSERQHWATYMTGDVVQLIEEWAFEDFLRFEYPRFSPEVAA